MENIELLLKYCKRFYARQFSSCSEETSDLLIRLEDFMQDYFKGEVEVRELLTVKKCAKEMLSGTEEPVYRIASTLGFEYAQHFSKLFKKNTGFSPGQYRQQSMDH